MDDLFGYTTPQGKLFDAPQPVSSGPPVHTPDTIRAMMEGILGEARAANVCPWTPRVLHSHRGMWPFYAEWFPREEAARLQAEFDAELTRLGLTLLNGATPPA